MMKGLAFAAILALLAAAVANEVPQRLSACDTDRGEPVCLDKMASYATCLGSELSARLSEAAAQCHFDNAADRQADGGEVDEVSVPGRKGQGQAKRGNNGRGNAKRGNGKRDNNGRRRGGKDGNRPAKAQGRPNWQNNDAAEDRQRRRQRQGRRRGRRNGRGKSSESSEEEDDFDVLDYVRSDVEDRTCVYRTMGWVCEESGQVDLDKMREDISTAFMGQDFDWNSALLTCQAVKFPMLCSLTERIQEDLDIAGFEVDLDELIHRLSEEERQDLGRLAQPLGFFNCAMAAFHAGCKATVEDMLIGATASAGRR